MLRKLLSATLLIAATAAISSAQSKPDFNGTWKLNVAKSDFGPIPGPDSRTDVLKLTDASLEDSVTQESAQGKVSYKSTYTLDGKENVNTPGGREIKSTAAWDGNTIVINSKFKFQDNDVTGKGVWSVSEDGKVLTLASHFESPMGEADQKYIFEKQTGDAVVSSIPKPAPAPAGAKSDYTGTWKLNVAKSDFGMLPPPESRTDVIDHKEPALKIDTVQVGGEGKMEYTVNLTTDGKESVANIGGRDVKSAAAWDGGNLVVNSKLNFNDMDIAIKAVYALGDEGKTLNIAAHIVSPMGEMDQKYIYEKQPTASGSK